MVVVSTPSLAFSLRFVEAQEPVGVQTFDPELTVEAFDVGIVGRFTRPTEVESDVVHEGPQIEFLADELRPVVETDRLWIAHLKGGTIECCDDIAAAPGLAHLDRGRQPGESIDDGQGTDLAAV